MCDLAHSANDPAATLTFPSVNGDNTVRQRWCNFCVSLEENMASWPRSVSHCHQWMPKETVNGQYRGSSGEMSNYCIGHCNIRSCSFTDRNGKTSSLSYIHLEDCGTRFKGGLASKTIFKYITRKCQLNRMVRSL